MTDSPLKRPLDDELLDAEAERQRKRSYGREEGQNMVIRTQKQLRCEDYKIGVICAIEFEMSAIRYMLDDEHPNLPSARGDSNLYVLGELSGHNVVVACLPFNQGKGAAAIVTANMSRTFPKVDLRLLVGIGGGLPSGKHDIRLGDVVISVPDGLHGGVVQYDLGKDTEECFVPKGHLSPVPSILRSAVVRMQSDHRITPSKINGFLMGMIQKGGRLSLYQKPQTEDILFQHDSLHIAGHETCDGCDMEKKIDRRPREAECPQIHYGLIASGDRVMRSANKALLATRDLGDVLCFEMEAAGVLTEYPCLVIRGISDYADSHKNDVWQHYAAASAAACSKELLSFLDPVIPDDMACSRTMRITPEASVGRIGSSISQDQKQRLLESLKFPQIDARRNTVKRAHVQTCKWLLRAPEYLEWLDEAKVSEHHGILWIKGKPGAGKSTLMKFALSNVPKVMKGKLILYFFFNARGEELEKSTVGMYRSLLWQLLSQIPDLLAVFDSLDLKNSEVGEEHQWSIETMKELFQDAIKSLKQTPPVLFIDALDECDEIQIRDMLRFFEDTAESVMAVGVSFHVLLSSRHYPHITIRRGLELVLEGQEGHNQDIKNYVDKELNIGRSNLAAQIRCELQEKASGVFMWVVLVVEILNKEHDRGRMHRLRQKLRDIPDDLHSLFRDILMRDQDDRDQLLLCVQWILLARQPLTPMQLYCALLIEIEPEALEDWTAEAITAKDIERFIVDCSKGLAETTITKISTVQFIHESVRDFLLKENGFSQIWPELGSNFQGLSQEKLKICCLKYMALDISTGLDIREPFPKASSNEMAAIRTAAIDRFPFLEYAIRNILYHADMAAAAQLPQQAFLQNFPLSIWNRLHNLFEKHEIRRHTPNVSLQYILAEYNFPNLIKALPLDTSWLKQEGERYGLPLFAGLAMGNKETMQTILKLCAIQKPQESKLLNLHTQYINSVNGRKFLGRDFKFSKKRSAISYIAELGDEILFAFLLGNGFLPDEKIKIKTAEHHYIGRQRTTGLKLSNSYSPTRALPQILEMKAKAHHCYWQRGKAPRKLPCCYWLMSVLIQMFRIRMGEYHYPMLQANLITWILSMSS
ncbi:hypothetical protein BDV06DRAFT_204849 [Aspergillus oleicola]